MISYTDIGYQIAVEVINGDAPPLVFISGVQDDRTVWAPVLDSLRSSATTLVYDRPALGRSAPLTTEQAKEPHGCSHSADELRRVLDALGLQTPYILVGHSIGALAAIVQAARYPQHCAGLVLVDPSDPTLFTDVQGFSPSVSDDDRGTCFDWRMIDEDFSAAERPSLPAVVVASAEGRWHRECAPERYKPLSLAEVDARWQRWQRNVARQLHASLVVASEAGHRVHVEAPGLVAHVVDAVTAAVRTRRPVTLDRAAVQEVGGTPQDHLYAA